jgi:hypothetical protein
VWGQRQRRTKDDLQLPARGALLTNELDLALAALHRYALPGAHAGSLKTLAGSRTSHWPTEPREAQQRGWSEKIRSLALHPRRGYVRPHDDGYRR